jgi:sugar O-acyltransferase (sialic acid O-acetyltransferase NeuD family)
MVSDIVIIGAGGTSRDLIELIEAINDDKQCWNLLGILDDDLAIQGQEVFGYPVLGTTSFMKCRRFSGVYSAIGVANERQLLVRKEIRNRLRLPTDRYPALIHPSAIVSRRSDLSSGTIIMSGVSCAGRVVIGAGAIILQNCAIGHDVGLNDFVTVSITVAIGGSARIEEGAYLGMGCSIAPGTKVGRQAVIGMGAVVIRNVPDHCVVVGNPAHIISMPSSYLLEALS